MELNVDGDEAQINGQDIGSNIVPTVSQTGCSDCTDCEPSSGPCIETSAPGTCALGKCTECKPACVHPSSKGQMDGIAWFPFRDDVGGDRSANLVSGGGFWGSFKGTEMKIIGTIEVGKL